MFKEIFKGSIIIFVFKIAGVISTFLANIVISRYYGVETLGVYNLIFSLLSFLSIFSILGLDLYIVRKIPEIESNFTEFSLFIKKVLKIVAVTSIIIGLAVLLFSGAIEKYLFQSKNSISYIYGLSIILMFYSLSLIFASIFRGFGDVYRFSFFQLFLLQCGLLLVLSIPLLFFRTKMNVIYSFYSLIFIIFILEVYFLNRFLTQRYSHKFSLMKIQQGYTSPIITYSFPMMITSSAIFMMSYLNTFFISYFMGIYEVGLYSAIQKLSMPLIFLTTSISTYIAPKISQNYITGNFKAIKKIYYNTMKILLLGGVPIFLGLFIFPEFFLGLFGKEFTQEITALHIYNLSAFIGGSLFGPIGYFLVMTDNQHAFQKIILFSLVLNVIISLVMIPHWGIKGAAFATLVATATWKMLGYYVLRREKIV